MEKVNDVGKGSWGRVGLGYLLIMTLLVLLGGLLSLFMRCSIQGADKRLPLPGDPPRLAKKGTHLAALPLHSGNALPLFWHCRLCTVCNPRNHWLL
ncbi:hypothetical protein F2S74_07465 [Pseudomonas syringae pv. actinidiae]|nr:hypothetical protein [Pseudomonas syringae pv. actinidiae]